MAAIALVALGCGQGGATWAGVLLTVRKDAALALDQVHIEGRAGQTEIAGYRPEFPRALEDEMAVQLWLEGAPDGATFSISVQGLHGGEIQAEGTVDVTLDLGVWARAAVHLAPGVFGDAMSDMSTDGSLADASPEEDAEDATKGELDGSADAPISECVSGTWTPMTTVGAPAAASQHVAAWTGTEMLVWAGGTIGGRYDPILDSWSAMSASGLAERDDATAVWTDSEMLVWGGETGGAAFSDGARYDPEGDGWDAMAFPPLSGRFEHTAVWTGSVMIVWGGGAPGATNTGGRYNPVADMWTPTATTGAPSARSGHAAVWTGSHMVVWGGAETSEYPRAGGRYHPSTDTWLATTIDSAPTGRLYPEAVWTGSVMIVWGGWTAGVSSGTFYNSGGRYSPSENTWTDTDLSGAPSGRRFFAMVWAVERAEAIVWGGYPLTTSGGLYSPATDSWTDTPGLSAAWARQRHTMVWTGSEAIVWGGQGVSKGTTVNTGARYCP